jgi:probable rRNA maturation factor
MINFFVEDIPFKLTEKQKHKNWLKAVAQAEGFAMGDLNYIFCSDEYLLNVNRQYLDHDYYTDIITFDNSEEENRIDGDIFVSIDRIKDNAKTLNQPYEYEQKRVLVHGLLHLLGYPDKSEEEASVMRSKEELYIKLF